MNRTQAMPSNIAKSINGMWSSRRKLTLDSPGKEPAPTIEAASSSESTDESGGANEDIDDGEYANFLNFIGLEEVDDDDDDGDDIMDAEDLAGVRSKCTALQGMVSHLEYSRSLQEDQIEVLRAEAVKLRFLAMKSQQESESALAHLREECDIATSQRSALEGYLVELNNSAGAMRESLSSSHPSRSSPSSVVVNEEEGTGAPAVLVVRVAMLEKENEVLKSSAETLRERVDSLTEEKRTLEEEMGARLECRETTISNLENSLRVLQRASRLRFSKKKKKKASSVKGSSSVTPTGPGSGGSPVTADPGVERSYSADKAAGGTSSPHDKAVGGGITEGDNVSKRGVDDARSSSANGVVHRGDNHDAKWWE